jgi:hypothetical protein
MNQRPMNLRPYGNSGMQATNTPAGSMEEAALQRAVNKLDAVRSRRLGDKPAGIDKRRFGIALVLAILAGLPFLLLTLGLASDAEFGGAIIFGIFTLLFLSIPVIYFITTRPDTPKRLLTQYYLTLGRGRFNRAREMVVSADFDDFPRFQPYIPKLGQPTGVPLHFMHDSDFKRYWQELLRANPSPYCYTRVSDVRETQVAPDVMIVDFQVRFTMNTSLYMLLILVALLIALIVDLATRKVVTVQLRKVLVKIDDEWKMFEGDWQGYAEHDTSWLR